MDVETANGFAKFLAYVLDSNADFDTEKHRVYEGLTVSKPIVNNITITLKSGKQYIIGVRPVK